MSRFIFIGVLLSVLIIIAGALYLGGSHILLFHPAGPIASAEVATMWLAFRLMLLVVVPVFILAAVMAWHYRASNKKAEYLPDWEHNSLEEAVWWAVPILIIAILGGVAWRGAHDLDPFKPIASDTPTLTVQVVSLDWKWLFLYPAQGIATVNYLEIPSGTPVDFELTSDAPMNAFWIPQLGGMEMTMPGMVTHLNLMANTAGVYRGLSSNLSGAGFAGMQFPVYSVSPEAFTAWVANTQTASTSLTWPAYEKLAQRSASTSQAFFARTDPNLFDAIVMQYMMPTSSLPTRLQMNEQATSSMQMPEGMDSSMPGMDMDAQ